MKMVYCQIIIHSLNFKQLLIYEHWQQHSYIICVPSRSKKGLFVNHGGKTGLVNGITSPLQPLILNIRRKITQKSVLFGF